MSSSLNCLRGGWETIDMVPHIDSLDDKHESGECRFKRIQHPALLHRAAMIGAEP